MAINTQVQRNDVALSLNSAKKIKRTALRRPLLNTEHFVFVTCFQPLLTHCGPVSRGRALIAAGGEVVMGSPLRWASPPVTTSTWSDTFLTTRGPSSFSCIFPPLLFSMRNSQSKKKNIINSHVSIFNNYKEYTTNLILLIPHLFPSPC